MPPANQSTAATRAGHAGTVPPASRLLLFGIECRFTSVVLRALLAHDARVVGLVLPGPPWLQEPLVVRPAPRLHLAGATDASLATWAAERGRTVLRVGSFRSTVTVRVLAALRPDVLAVACYPTRIPSAIAALAPLGAFNVHPSLLPRWRGPDPLFWTLRAGDATTGVTIHQLARRFDAGPIAAQDAWELPLGAGEAELETHAAQRGAELLLDAMRAAERGTLTLTPQDDAAATYAPWPTADDYALDDDMPARLAFAFARGVLERGEPLTALHDGRRVRLVSVSGWAAHGDAVATPLGETALRFGGGVVFARVTPLDG